ncbi:glycosyltransferase family 4 protein [Methanobacterium oryzae]|uniref:glycosyltransferase family 4 protein n=1 Tax=Methanobacterium oryzae TaxID=69540 RepID=UPI003D1FA43E
MKICIITEYFPKSDALDIKGGAEACAFNEAKYLVNAHEVTVITSYEAGIMKKDNIYGINVIRCGKKRKYVQKGSLISRFNFMIDAYKTGKNEDFDILVGYNFVTYPIAWKIAGKLKKPCVLRYHDMWIGEWIKNFGISGIFGELMERYILSRDLDMILSVSEYTKNKLKRYFDPKKIIVIPNIVDVPQIKAHKFQKLTICCVSRLVEYKRVDDLLRAVSIIKETVPDIQCKIIGSGTKEIYLKKLVKDLKISENVEFCGFIEDHDDVLKVVKASHVFCLPSVVEGFGIVIVEAMASGVPFVASNIPPLVEASGGKGGLFFEPKNYGEMADKIKYILNNKELQKSLGDEGISKSKEYMGEKIAMKIESIYAKLIKDYKNR